MQRLESFFVIRMEKRSLCVSCDARLTADSHIHGSLNDCVEPEALLRAWTSMETRKFFPYFRCVACGTLNVRLYPSQSRLQELYSRMPGNMQALISVDNQALNQRQYASIIKDSFLQLPELGIRVLELGSDRGIFLGQLKTLLPGGIERIAAIEPNQEVLPELVTLLSQMGLPYKCFSELSEVRIDGKNDYDLIVGIHVFDHVFDLSDLISSLRVIASRSARIFFVVHNPQSLLAVLMGRYWPPYSVQHPQLFTVKGVKALAAKHGLRLISTGRTVNHFSLSMVVKYLFGVNLICLDSVSLRLPLGNRYYLLGMQ